MLATLTLVVGIFALSLVYAVVLDRYGEPDWGPIYAGYLALALHASLLVAVGLLMSSITENQVVAAALSIGTFLMLWFADLVSYLLPPPSTACAINLSLIGHFKPMVSGSVFLSDIGYFVTASMLGAFPYAPGGLRSGERGQDQRSAGRGHRLLTGLADVQLLDAVNLGWSAGIVVALALLFAAGLKVPSLGLRPAAWHLPALVVAAAVGGVILANVALFRHDAHLDLTRERAFTPSAEARQIVRGMKRAGRQSPISTRSRIPAPVRSPPCCANSSDRTRFSRVEFDRRRSEPGAGQQSGVRTYNSAMLRLGERRIEVVTTDDREIALAMLRLLRPTRDRDLLRGGHGEYDIDNFEFHTHFEGSHGHSHDTSGIAVVQMEQHGLGRFGRASRSSASSPARFPSPPVSRSRTDCAAMVEANPRTRYSPGETDDAPPLSGARRQPQCS